MVSIRPSGLETKRCDELQLLRYRALAILILEIELVPGAFTLILRQAFGR